MLNGPVDAAGYSPPALRASPASIGSCGAARLPPRPVGSMQDRWAPWSAKHTLVRCAPSETRRRARRGASPASICAAFCLVLAALHQRTLHMVYHGRMDRNRGARAPDGAQKAKNAGLDVTLTLMGEGDASAPSGAWRRARRRPRLAGFLRTRWPSPRVAPRPAADAWHRAWSLASAQAVGVPRFWPDGRGHHHDGHRLSGETPFMHLFAKGLSRRHR